MENILKKYIDTEVGVSFRNGKVEVAVLKSVNAGFIIIKSNKTVQHIPFHSVSRFIETESEVGDRTYSFFRKRSYPLTIIVSSVVSIITTY